MRSGRRRGPGIRLLSWIGGGEMGDEGSAGQISGRNMDSGRMSDDSLFARSTLDWNFFLSLENSFYPVLGTIPPPSSFIIR